MNKAPLHIWTPTIYSEPLSKLTNKNIWLKMECHQPVGSYKIRGIGRLCQHYVIRKNKTNLVSSSGGNAGIAVAYSAKRLGVQADVFLPSTSKKIYIEKLQLEGAKIHVVGNVWDEADEVARQHAKEINGAYIPPFDHHLIWSGHSTLIQEVAENGIIPDAIVVAVGGGGLASGLIEGMHQLGWNDIPVFAVEPLGAASFAKSIEANKLITLNEVNTISTSLATKKVTHRLFELAKIHTINSILVSDQSSVKAIKNFANDHRILVEPASGAALSVIYEQSEKLKNYNSILVIVCGGNGISLDLLQEYTEQFN